MKHPDFDHEKYHRQIQTSSLIGLLLGTAAIALFLIWKILSEVLTH